ncbi:MAG: HlyD family type I secretion periplasmic adaptor subunit [Pseudomonadota bacterium]
MNAPQIAGPAGAAAGKKDDGWTGRGFIRFGLICVLILGGGFGGWAATASLAGAVIAMGQLRVESNRQVVQHPDGGVVEAIAARDGDVVEAGAVVIRLEATQLQSELNALESQLFEIMARRGRLEATIGGEPEITFDEELTDRAAIDADIGSLMNGQKALFEAQIDSRTAEVAILGERKLQLQDQITGTEAQLASVETQSELIVEELVDVRELVNKGLAPKARLLALLREQSNLKGESGRLLAQAAELKGRISEIEIQQSQMDTTMIEEANAESRELGFREFELGERRRALQQRLSRLEIRAPRAGTIIDSTVHALGSVIRSAEPIMYVIPSDAALVIDGRVEPTDIDLMYVGQEAVLRFSSLNARTTPELFGEIVQVAPDVVVDEQTGLSFYRIEVKMRDGEIAKLEDQELIAGMPVEVYVQTGERTPIAYLMKPITDYFNRAWRES